MTVVTATTGSDDLKRNLISVQNSVNADLIQHLVVVDGDDRAKRAYDILFEDEIAWKNRDVITIPEATGKNNWNAHRINAAMSYLVNTPLIAFLDEDNVVTPEHYDSLIRLFDKREGLQWGYSLRSVFSGDTPDQLTPDNCESLGVFNTCIGANDHLVDVSCFIMQREVAVSAAPLWYRRARQPGVMPADRSITQFLLQNFRNFGTTGKHSLLYKVGNRTDSVQEKFFIDGNARVRESTNRESDFPWEREFFSDEILKTT